MIVVALVEESSKYVAVRVSVYGSRAFNEPMDGLVYGAIAGLGFAAPENLLYVLNRGAVLGIVRAVLSVPGHALWGSIIGYYLARQKLDARRHMGLVGLVYAVLLHTIFDFGLVGADPLLGIAIASTVVLAGWTVFFRMKKSALAASPFRPEVLPPMPASMAVKYCISCGSAISVEDRFCRSCGALQL
jgi:RsiW-degrading membrane proteinase PrsW (M82 family)